MRNKLCLCACAFIISIQQSEFGYYGRTFYGPDRVHGRVRSAYACTRPRTHYTAVHGPSTRPCRPSHWHVPVDTVRTRPCNGTVCTAMHTSNTIVYKTVHTARTRPVDTALVSTLPCTRGRIFPGTRPVPGPVPAVHMYAARVHSRRPIYGPCTPPCARSVHGGGRGPCPRCKGRVHGRVHDYLYTSQFHGRVQTLSTAV